MTMKEKQAKIFELNGMKNVEFHQQIRDRNLEVTDFAISSPNFSHHRQLLYSTTIS